MPARTTSAAPVQHGLARAIVLHACLLLTLGASEDGTLIVGSEFDFPPFSLGRSDPEADGFAVALWKSVAAQRSIAYRIRVRPWSDLLSDFRAGRVDVLVCAASSPERRAFARFSVTHATDSGAIFVRHDDRRLASEADLAHRSVAVVRGDLAHEYLLQHGRDSSLVLVEKPADGMRLVRDGGADAMLISRIVGTMALRHDGIAEVAPLPIEAGPSRRFCFAVQPDAHDLLESLNEGLAVAKADGRYDAIYDHWLGPFEARRTSFVSLLPYLWPWILGTAMLGTIIIVLIWRQADRRRMESVVRESDARFRAFMDNCPSIAWAKDADGRLIYTNRSFHLRFGLRIDDWHGKAGSEQLPPSVAEAFSRHDAVVLAGGGPVITDESTSDPDGNGRSHWRLAAFSFTDASGRKHVGCMARDVTPQITAERSLEDLRERTRIAFAASGIGAWDVAVDGSDSLRTPEHARIFGQADSSGPWSFARFLQHVHADDRDRVQACIRSAVAEGVAWDFECRINRDDGECRRILVQGQKHQSRDGVDRYVGIVLDVTDRRDMERRLGQAEKLASLGQLAGGVAHNFNNLLAAIMGHTELLSKRLPDPQLARYTDAVIGASRRAADLVAQLLAFARKPEARTVAVDVHALVRETVIMLQGSIDRLIVIDMRLDAAAATVMGDASQLQTMLLNLAINARDAMPGGGTLAFVSRNVPAPAGRQALSITVSDTGTGMDAEVQRRLFEPFFTTKEIGKGTGLGLAAVHGIIASHQGTIAVRSSRGKGTSIEVILPVREADGCATASTGSAPPVTAARRARILVVDDEPEVLSMSVEALGDLGYQVTASPDGPDAVERFRTAPAPFDLVLLDLVMPGMSGVDVLAAMRAINPGCRFLICSGYTRDGQAESLIAAGACGVLAKPFETPALSRCVAQALGQAAADP